MPRRVDIEPSDLISMISERLLDYDHEDLVKFWERNFGHDPRVDTDESGDGLIAEYED